MWNMGHLDRSYDESIVQQTPINTTDYHPSTAGSESSYYPARAVSASSHHGAPGFYAAVVPTGGVAETFAGLHNQPRAMYGAGANGNRAFHAHDYSSNGADGHHHQHNHPDSSSGASFAASRSASYDSAFPQALTPDSHSGLGGTHVDAYNYMYSQSSRGPPALSPTAAPQKSHGNNSTGIKKTKATSTSRQQRKTKHPYQAFSPDNISPISGASSSTTGATTTTTTGTRSKLRSASRTSKNTHHNPPASLEERRSRETHNNVEKQYRNRLNAHFESLLSALPERMQSGESGAGGDSNEGLDQAGSDRRVSKAEVLEMARKHIMSLEHECAALEGERDELRENMEKLRWLFGRCEGGGGGHGHGVVVNVPPGHEGTAAAAAFLDSATQSIRV
ncbi:hypothetical protein F5Y17DRAFT_462848 [Xylariaceae sp. FL0594]|nr:hypothetical protein F5Y17DRAFT_462848 [Xylariaceae sp. FL0594]